MQLERGMVAVVTGAGTGITPEVMSRAFIGRRRQERGFGTNPWSTHTRFMPSRPTK